MSSDSMKVISEVQQGDEARVARHHDLLVVGSGRMNSRTDQRQEGDERTEEAR